MIYNLSERVRKWIEGDGISFVAVGTKKEHYAFAR